MTVLDKIRTTAKALNLAAILRKKQTVTWRLCRVFNVKVMSQDGLLGGPNSTRLGPNRNPSDIAPASVPIF